jgi:hypothetical protein
MGILSPQGVGKAHPPIALGKVLAMLTTHLLQMALSFSPTRQGNIVRRSFPPLPWRTVICER